MQAVIWSPDLKQAVKNMKNIDMKKDVSRFNNSLAISADEKGMIDNMLLSTNKVKKEPLSQWA